jgi:TM2 domain-containing membrane protein YozV
MALPPTDPPLPPVKLDPLAALLSYLIPGLGQIYQGRVGKGLLFFCGLYALFFYGMWMGQWRNVWLPDTDGLPEVTFAGQKLGDPLKAVSYRFQFLGQVWIGTAAWPAVYQYAAFDRTKDAGPIFGKFQRMPDEKELNDLQRNGNKRWDLGWVYTVIAGVLNLLVIYDALAGPMFRDPPADWHEDAERPAAVPGPAPAPPAAEAAAPTSGPGGGAA